MTIDQILIKTEGMKKNTKMFDKNSLSFTEALYSLVKALKMLSTIAKKHNSSIEWVLKEYLSKNDYDEYLATRDELSKASKLNFDNKVRLTAFNLAYFLKEVALSLIHI